MKKILSLLAVMVAVQFSYAQTNTFPASGNVGIGTTSPATNLDIAGSIQISGTASTTPSTGVSYGLFPYGGVGLGIFSGAFDPEQGIGIWTNPGGTKTEVMRILSGGNVGIGTTSPSLSLEVAGDPTIYGGIAYQSTIQSRDTRTYATGVGGGITFAGNYTALPNNTTFAGIAGVKENSTSGDYAGALLFSTRVNGAIPAERMRISSTGNVAIGTTDPQGHKLAVNGDIIATKITVKPYGNWPDYVFKPQYKLPSLSEVKSYIDQNQHLPDMPSEQEIAKGGVDLGEIVKIQTKKIEELTLYLIEKDKKEQKQSATNKKLEEEIQELKTQFKALKNQ